MTIPDEISTALRLAFLDEDHRHYPWLKGKTRTYRIDSKPLGQGAFGTALLGYPLKRGNEKFLEDFKVVVKIPLIDLDSHHSRDELDVRLAYIQRKSVDEFLHIRKRLAGYPYANPAIDLAPYLQEDEYNVTATIQPYVGDAYVLDEWLYKAAFRPDKVVRKDRQLQGDWSGIKDRAEWLKIALRIARSLQGLHRRRVTHGDIHPGNIMLHLDEQPSILIDFGEAFVATPARNWRKRNKNPYLAPERSGSRSHINERVDVYSFGILLLYLATGQEKQLAFESVPARHRSVIYNALVERNLDLIKDEPRILDVIAKSTARDPADRPRMSDICDDLENIASTGGNSPATYVSVLDTLTTTTAKLKRMSNEHNQVLLRLLNKQVSDLSDAIDGLQTEMIELYGTRERLLRSLNSLFDSLTTGDSWSTVTTLAIWQRNALGSNGSYSSATTLAARRGVSIRRTFLVSVEEIGIAFSEFLRNELANCGHPALVNLGHLFDVAIKDYNAIVRDKPAPEFITWHRERFIIVLSMMKDTVNNWEPKPMINRDAKIDITSSEGLFLGICPLVTLDDVNAVKEDNPASLVYVKNAGDESRRWLLVMTEARGRCEDRTGIDSPHLLGVRVFKSVMGIPKDRIKYMQRVMNDKSSNVAGNITELLNCALSAEKDFSFIQVSSSYYANFTCREFSDARMLETRDRNLSQPKLRCGR